MKKNKLDRFETKIAPEITPEQDKQNREIIVSLLTPVVEKVQNLPIVPVSETFDELMTELKSGVNRSPVVVQMFDGNRVSVAAGVTEIITPAITKDVTFTDGVESTLTITKDDTFTDSEKLILEQLTLEQIQNG